MYSVGEPKWLKACGYLLINKLFKQINWLLLVIISE